MHQLVEICVWKPSQSSRFVAHGSARGIRLEHTLSFVTVGGGLAGKALEFGGPPGGGGGGGPPNPGIGGGGGGPAPPKPGMGGGGGGGGGGGIFWGPLLTS